MATTASERVTVKSIFADRHIGPAIGLVFIIMAGIGVVFPVMPLYARSFGVGYDGVGLFIGAFGFMRLFGDLLGGVIVDRKGERWTAIAGLTLLAACATATGLAPNYPVAIVSWGIAGVGSAVSSASMFTYIVKVAPADRVGRVLSFFFGAFNIGVIAGGALGGVVAAQFGLAAPLFVYAVIVAIGAGIYVPLFIPPIERPAPRDAVATPEIEGGSPEVPLPSSRPVRSMLALPGFMTAMVINLAYLWMVAAVFNTLLSLFARDELGMPTATIGLLFSLTVAVEFIVLFPAGAWADRYGRKSVVVPGLLGLALSIGLMGFAGSVWVLAALLVATGVTGGFAGVPPAAMVSDVVPEHQKGLAMGTFRFFGDIGFLLGPLVAGAASNKYGFGTAFILSAIPCVAALVMTIRTAETLKKEPVTLTSSR